MIDAINLTKSFTKNGIVQKAVDDVSFHVDKGDIYAIIGMSGAGKSTLVRLLNLLELPDSGKILIDGVDITTLNKKDLSKVRREMAFIFQRFNLFNQITVLDNVVYPLTIGKNVKNAKESALEMLDYVGLADKKSSYPSELSGGEAQRVAIARALVTRPKIILSDEATSALDPKSTRAIIDLYKKAQKDFDTTTILITHQMEVAKDVSNRIAVMEKGKIIEENSTIELFKNPKTSLAQTFIKSTKDATIHKSNYKGVLKRLSYTTKTVNTPVLNDTIKNFEVVINILEANINNIESETLGYMVVEFSGEEDEIKNAIDYLTKHNVEVSEVCYEY